MKKYIGVVITLFLIFVASVHAGQPIYSPKQLTAPYMDARSFTTLALADAAAVAAGKSLLISSNWTLVANTTIASPVIVLKGGGLTKASTYTLTFSGDFDAGLYQVFFGFSAGDVTGLKEARPQWFGAVSDGVTDDSAAIQAMFDSLNNRSSVNFPSGVYRMMTAVTVNDKVVTVDATDAKFSIGANVIPFTFTASTGELVALTANYTKSSLTLTVATMASPPAVGDYIKIVSDAVDPANRDSGSGSSQYRVGEWAIVTASTATTITLSRPLRFVEGIDPTSTAGDESIIDSYTTTMNARVLMLSGQFSLNWTGGKMYYDGGHDADWTSGMFRVTGLIKPVIKDLSIVRGYGPGILLTGNYGAHVIGGESKNLNDNPSTGQYGYGVADSGYGTVVDSRLFSNVRHGYTTNTGKESANNTTFSGLIQRGRTVGSHITNCIGMGGVSPIFDTHHDAEDTIFSGNVSIGSPSFAASLRGRNLTIENHKIVNSESGIQIFTEYQSGDADDDLYVSGKPHGQSTATIRNIEMQVKTNPLKFSNARKVVLSGTINVMSTDHILIDNDGSNVLIDGTIRHTVTNFNNAEAITEQTGVAAIDVAVIGTQLSSAADYDANVTVTETGALDLDYRQATDALNNLKLITLADNTTFFRNYGKVRTQLSGDFSTLISGGTTVNLLSRPGSALSWSVAGVADDTITVGLPTGLDFNAYTEDYTEMHGTVLKNTGMTISNFGNADTTITRTMHGIEHIARGMNTTNKYTPAVKFMSSDSELTTENPKLGAYIVGYAEQTYDDDADGGMGIEIGTTPNSPGATSVPVARLKISGAGQLIGMATTNGPIGTFTCAAAATTTINNTAVKASSLIFLQPTNAAAAALEAAATKLYINTLTAGTSFTVTTGNGAAAAGTETFNYWMVN